MPGGVIAASLLSYRYIEKPGQAVGRRLAGRIWSRPVAGPAQARG